MSVGVYVYCHDCKKLLAVCAAFEFASCVEGYHRATIEKDKGEWHTVTVGTKKYFKGVYPEIELNFTTPIELPPIEKDEPVKYVNHYHCNDCNTEWQDEWSCACDDECPICATSYSPYKSEDINEEQKTITILYHDITYWLADDSTINIGDSEYEHILYMIQGGYKEGELIKADPKDENKTIRGYWRIEK